MSLAPGSTLGPYTIRAELGHGGMGVVYTAHDPHLKRQVAIKLLTADLTRDDTAKQRFLQEAQAASVDCLVCATRSTFASAYKLVLTAAVRASTLGAERSIGVATRLWAWANPLSGRQAASRREAGRIDLPAWVVHSLTSLRVSRGRAVGEGRWRTC